MIEPLVFPGKDRLLRLLTLTVAVTLLTLGWLSWTTLSAYRFATRQLPAISRMEKLRGHILLFDEVLTMSARMSAATADPQWEARYRRFDPQLEEALKEIMRLGPVVAHSRAAAQTDAANTKLVAMENRAFDLVRRGQQAGAQELLSSEEYESQKKVYAAGMAELNRLLEDASVSVRAKRQVQLRWSFVTAAISAPLLMLSWWLVLRAARRWRRALVESNQQLSRNTAELEAFSRQLDEKVSERTKQLKESELATLNMMDDVVRSREKTEQAYEDIKREMVERRKLEERFREQASLLDKARDAILVRDLDHRITYWNQGAERLYGWTAQEAIGRSMGELLHKDTTAFRQACDHVIQTGEWVGEMRKTGKDGRELIIEGRWTLVRDESGQPKSVLVINTNITERKRAEAELDKTHKELLESSRQAGMAEVATSVLHNVGNVLNSVNVASTCLADSLRKSKAANLSKVVAMLREHEADLGAFLTTDAKGKLIPVYLAQLAEHLSGEQAAALKELAQLQKNIEHIKDIVSMQQSGAKVSGVAESVKPTDLVEDALRMNASSLSRRNIEILKEFGEVPQVMTQKHKVVQILLNLIRNASQACDESGHSNNRLTLRVGRSQNGVSISVSDNGVGISPENLTRIFAHGFTTKKNGHGFGLHGAALAAKELGGSLTAHSDGVGRGATFTLELPVKVSEVVPSRGGVGCLQ